jgi:hypothetical protein
MTLDRIDKTAHGHGLMVMGAFHPEPDEAMTQGAGTVVMIGPSQTFWSQFKAAPEFGQPDQIDRWSARVIGQMAHDLGGSAVFPFGGPPYAPFLRWAKVTGRAWDSPVGMLVHDTTGLMVSYRGALLFGDRLGLPAPPAKSPCETCEDRPCLSTCPVGALGADGYDVASCHGFLDCDEGQDCMTRGCRVRRICPASLGAARNEEQSAHHMRAFRGNR